MAPLLPILIALVQSYTVLEVDQRSYFAGKYGQRVETRLRIQTDEGTKWISMPRQHTRAGKVRTFQVGEKISLL